MALMTRRRFNVDEFNRIAETGIFEDGNRVELIDGVIRGMGPFNDPHVACVILLTRLFVLRAGEGVGVSPQDAVKLDNNTEPVPDLVVAPLPADGSSLGVPWARDTLLVVEVSDSSLRFDQKIKVPRYARSGVPEVWIVDLNGRIVEAHRQPSGDRYLDKTVYRPGEQIIPSQIPHLTVTVDEILPRLSAKREG